MASGSVTIGSPRCIQCGEPIEKVIPDYFTNGVFVYHKNSVCYFTAKDLVIKEQEIMPSNNVSRVSYKYATARLAPVYEALRDTVFLGEDNIFDLTGAGVRDAIFGGVNPNNHYEVRFQIPANSFYRKLLENHLAKWQIGANKYKIVPKTGPIEFSFWTTPKFLWNCDIGSFNLGDYIAAPHIKEINKTKQIELINYHSVSKTSDAKEALNYGIELCQKYNWTIEEGTLKYLAGIIEQDAPLSEGQFVVGFRAYNIQHGYLYGGAGNPWETAQLSVDCPNFRQHMRAAVETTGGEPIDSSGRRIHGCGIYIYKDPAECVHYYGIGKSMNAIAAVVGWGDIWEGERGYRVEHSRIEKLWVFQDSPQLRPYEINGGVIVNASLGDFYKDIYSTGLEFEHNRGLR